MAEKDINGSNIITEHLKKHTYTEAMEKREKTTRTGNRLFPEIKIQPSDNQGAIMLLADRILVYSKESTPKIGTAITSYFEGLVKDKKK